MIRRYIAAGVATGLLLLPHGAALAEETDGPPDPGASLRSAPANHVPAGVVPPLLEFDKTLAVAINGAALSADETIVCGAPGPRRFLQELITDNPLQYKVPYRLGDVVSPTGPSSKDGRQYLMSGSAGGSVLGAGDFPFDHPFGSDFNMDVDPDPEFGFLSQLGGAVVNNDQHTELSAGQFPHTPATPPAAGSLWDDFSAFGRQNVQPGYLPQSGDRVIMQGRWVNDCGHPPFQTELHPFSYMAWAREEAGRTVSQGFYAPYREMQTYHPDPAVADDASNPNRYGLTNTYSFPQGLILSLFRIQDAGPAPFVSADHLESFQMVEVNTTPPPPYWVCAPAGSSGQYVGANYDMIARPGVTVDVFADHQSGCVYVVTSFANLSVPNPVSLPCDLPWDFLAEIASAEAGTPVDIKTELSKYVAPQFLSRMDPSPEMNCYAPVTGGTVSANPTSQTITTSEASASAVYGRLEVFRTDDAPTLPTVPSSTSSSSSSSSSASTSSPEASSSTTSAGQSLTVTPGTASRGSVISVQSNGWAPGAIVTVAVAGTVLGSLTADTSGRVSGSFTIPGSTALGAGSVVLAGTGNNGQALSLNTPLTVTPAVAATGSLPLTGADIARYVAFASALVLLGLGLVLLGRGRRARL